MENKTYTYECERCDEVIQLEHPVEHYHQRVHSTCPNHELVIVIDED